MFTRFERAHQPMIPPLRFAHRLLKASMAWVVLTVVGLVVGITGYMVTEGMSFLDAFANAAMILSGMGPLAELHHTSGKVFAGFYAIFSGLVLVIASGFVLAPIFHRVLHHFHLEAKRGD